MPPFERTLLEVPTGYMACWRSPQNAGKPPLLMGHGNGMSALCQVKFMSLLSDRFDVYGLDFRGHGATADRLPIPDLPKDPWKFYQDDLNFVIRQHFNGRVAYAGHSLGGVTALRIAEQNPDMFSHLIAIDPAILPTSLALIYPLVKRSNWLSRRNKLYLGALRRRAHWPDNAAAVQYFTGRKAFSTWPKSAIIAYVNSCLSKDETGELALKCPREWEARTFRYVASEVAWLLRKVSCKTLIVRADSGSIFPKKLHLGPEMTSQTVSGTHFVHLEKPKEIANLVLQFVGKGLA